MLDLEGKTIEDFFGKHLTDEEFDQLRESPLWEDELEVDMAVFGELGSGKTSKAKSYTYHVVSRPFAWETAAEEAEKNLRDLRGKS